MIGNLKLEAPHIWNLIRDQLIGGGGRPDALGHAVGGMVRDAEEKYNAEKGEYWYRFFRPNDKMINGGTEKIYYATMTAVTEEDILATGKPVTVQTAEAILSCGWYCDTDLARKGYLMIKKADVVKSLEMARVVWRQQKPAHFFVDLNTVIKAFENAEINYKIYNGFGSDRVAVAIPLLFRIAPRSSLNLERRVR